MNGNILKDWYGQYLDMPKVPDDLRQKVEGILRRRSETPEEVLDSYLKGQGVALERKADLLRRIRNIIAAETRPSWLGRVVRGGHLATLNAPKYLKEVHADVIAEDGTVLREDIVARDPALMRAIDGYLATRRNRNLDDGDAAGLKIKPEHPGRRPGAKATSDPAVS